MYSAWPETLGAIARSGYDQVRSSFRAERLAEDVDVIHVEQRTVDGSETVDLSSEMSLVEDSRA
jgi:hypothetical protein